MCGLGGQSKGDQAVNIKQAIHTYHVQRYTYHKARLFECKSRRDWTGANREREAVDCFREYSLEYRSERLGLSKKESEIDAIIRQQTKEQLQFIAGV